MRKLSAVSALLAVLIVTGCEEDETPDGVDVKIATVTIPYATGLGQGATVPVEVVVTSNGTETAAAGYVVTVSYYKDWALTETFASWPMMTYPAGPALAPGETWTPTPTPTTTINVTTTPCLVYCVAQVTDPGGDVNLGNNSCIKVIQVVTGGQIPGVVDEPDLTVKGITVPASVERASVLQVTVTVENAGGLTTGSGFDVDLEGFEDSEHTTVLWAAQTKTQVALGPGNRTDVKFQINVAADAPIGTAYLLARADTVNWDTGGQITETNEANNTRTATTEVTWPSEPDLIVSVTGGSSHFQIDDSGDRMSVYFTVTNEGNKVAGASLVGYELRENGGSWFQDFGVHTEVPELHPGESFSGTRSDLDMASVPQVGERYLLVVIADHGNDVTEANENNNEDSREVLVYTDAQANLTASVISVTTSVDYPAEKTIDVTYQIKNTGSGDAGTSMVHLELLRKSNNEWVAGCIDGPVGALSGGGGWQTLQETLYFSSVPALGEAYYVRVMADGNREVAESEEGDNEGVSADIQIY